MRKLLFFKRGTCIISEKPFAFVLQAKYRSERCDQCFKQGKVLKCSGCKYVGYCDRFCQKEAWTEHKSECIKLKSLYPRTIPNAAIMMSRIVRKLQNGGDYEKGYYSNKLYRRFGNLMSHKNDIKNDPIRMEHFESLFVVLQSLIDHTAMPCYDDLLEIFGKMCINCFNILDEEMNTIGTGMYLGTSILDHSCQPNAVATFDGTTVKIRLLEDYNSSEMDHSRIFISYIDIMNTPEERKKQLQNSYYFQCECPRCSDEKEAKLMISACCSNENCDEPVHIEMGKCLKCGTSVKHSRKEDYKEVMSLTITKLAEMKDVAFLDVCNICLLKQKNLLHYYNVWFLRTLDNAFESAVEMENWDEAIEKGLKLLKGFRKYNGDFHPLLGLLHLKIGKIQLYRQQIQTAFKNITEAEKILRVTHGEQHSLYRTKLIPILCQAADEFNAIEN